jgi:hypothetical protein
MRPLLSGLFVAAMCLSADARASVPTTVVIRNPGPKSSRVQLALGATMPCDSAYNRLVFDEVLEPGAVRVFYVDAVQGCARNTSGGSTLDWVTSQFVYGGFRCRRKFACWPDPSVPMEFTAIP